jgi:hypothetical protein
MSNSNTNNIYSFIALFNDGYAFRNIFEYLKTEYNDCKFYFKRDSIYMKQLSQKQDMITEIIINTSDLVQYDFYSDSDFSKGFDVSIMKAALADVGKKDSVKFSLLKNDSAFNIQIITPNNHNFDNNAKRIPIKSVDEIKIEMDEFSRKLDNPNFVWPLSDVSKNCKTISVGCDFISLSLYSKGCKLDKICGNNSVEHSCKFGKTDDTLMTGLNSPKINLKVKPLYKLNLKSDNIKNLDKCKNFSVNTNVKFYFEEIEGAPIRLLIPIGCFGYMIFYGIHIEDIETNKQK